MKTKQKLGVVDFKDYKRQSTTTYNF